MSSEQTTVKDEMYTEMLPDFLDEAAENLDRLNEHLLHLDEQVKADTLDGADSDVLNEMFRAAHTLKGLSGMLGLQNINALTHKVENVFDAARNSELELSADVIDVVFVSIDRLSEMLTRLRDGQDDVIDCAQVLNDIATLLQQSGVERPQTSQQDAEQAMLKVAAATDVSEPTDALPPGSDDATDGNAAAAPTSDGVDVEATEQAAAEPATSTENAATTEPASPTTAAPEDTTSGPPQFVSSDPFADFSDDADLTSKYISIFVDEAELTLDELTEALLTGADENVTERVLILCHRMKGSAATIGLGRAAKLAHFMEDLLQVLQNQGAELTVEMTDAMLDCTEALRVFVTSLKHGQVQTEHFVEAYQKLIRSQSPVAPAPPVDSESVVPVVAEADKAETVTPSEDQPASTDAKRPSSATEVADAEESAELTPEDCERVTAAAPAGAACCVGQIVFRNGLPDAGLKAQLLYSKLANAGDIFFCEPPEEALVESDGLRVMLFGVATDTPPESVRTRLEVDGVLHVDVRPTGSQASSDTPDRGRTEGDNDQRTGEPAATSQSTPASGAALSSSNSPSSPNTKAATAASADKSGSAGKPTETVRVDIDRLDQLMNLAGQLVINKARFTQISGALRQLSAGKQNYNFVTNVFGSLKRLDYELDSCEHGRGTASTFEDIRAQTRRIQTEMEAVERRMAQFDGIRQSINELLEAVHQLDRVSHGIQKCVMDTRMVPIGPLFARFKRVVRDISRSNNKEIRLLIHGEKTELDKRMIDELGDPLIHIVRNSADHGIEPAEVRVAAGKPPEGTVTLDASHRGNSIVIQVIDDGKGLDAAKIRDKAVQKGLITSADADKMTKHQIYQLIWEPGLSTAAKVTEVSGRGMGMDIVRSKIEEINGTVELDSEPGQGTTITIKLPLTLAILPSLLAEIDGDVFAVPVESVSEIVSVETKDLSQVHGLETATVRGRVISVVALAQLFDWHEAAGDKSASSGDDKTLVIVGSDGREVGLVVDRLLGEEDIVIKSLAENYRNVDGIAGASILGDGRVSLILDVTGLVLRASQVVQPAGTK